MILDWMSTLACFAMVVVAIMAGAEAFQVVALDMEAYLAVGFIGTICAVLSLRE